MDLRKTARAGEIDSLKSAKASLVLVSILCDVVVSFQSRLSSLAQTTHWCSKQLVAPRPCAVHEVALPWDTL
eukprot:5523763-Amphidinium_carterae.1